MFSVFILISKIHNILTQKNLLYIVFRIHINFVKIFTSINLKFNVEHQRRSSTPSRQHIQLDHNTKTNRVAVRTKSIYIFYVIAQFAVVYLFKCINTLPFSLHYFFVLFVSLAVNIHLKTINFQVLLLERKQQKRYETAKDVKCSCRKQK